MPSDFDDVQESEIPQLALNALNAAQQRAVRSGRTVVIVDNGILIERGASGDKILKMLPPRRKVTNRVKRATK